MSDLPAPPFSDHLVFVDESGDHHLAKIDPQFPVFVLLFLVISKADYVNEICPSLQRFKFEFWGHDEVVLHEHEIRKPRDAFTILLNQTVRHRFIAELSRLMEDLHGTVIAVIIDKPEFLQHNPEPDVGVYDHAMQVGLERVYQFLRRKDQSESATPIIVEARGRREDTDLELAFRRVCDGHNLLHTPMNFHLSTIPKTSNSAGLQLADLMARPVALKHLRPDQPNRAFEIIKTKLYSGPDGTPANFGLNRLP